MLGLGPLLATQHRLLGSEANPYWGSECKTSYCRACPYVVYIYFCHTSIYQKVPEDFLKSTGYGCLEIGIVLFRRGHQ